MIVLDASAAAELILTTEAGTGVSGRLRGEIIHVPAHFEIEVAGVIRQAVLRGLIPERDGQLAMADLIALPMRRWPATPFVARAYELRHTHSIADAIYVALAEALTAPLLTCDARLARSHGHHARIETVRPPPG